MTPPTADTPTTPLQRASMHKPLDAAAQTLAEQIDSVLPQTQCTRCGYPDCSHYALAIATEGAPINRCPPGGAQGIERIAHITGQRPTTLDAETGCEGPRLLALIDEDWCIGCTKCIQVCPVDCIIGASRHMHTVLGLWCTGCELCVPVCPVDCISLIPSSTETPASTGSAAWDEEQANTARERYTFHQFRMERWQHENQKRLLAKGEKKLAQLEQVSKISDPQMLEHKRALIAQVLAKAKERS